MEKCRHVYAVKEVLIFQRSISGVNTYVRTRKCSCLKCGQEKILGFVTGELVLDYCSLRLAKEVYAKVKAAHPYVDDKVLVYLVNQEINELLKKPEYLEDRGTIVR